MARGRRPLASRQLSVSEMIAQLDVHSMLVDAPVSSVRQTIDVERLEDEIVSGPAPPLSQTPAAITVDGVASIDKIAASISDYDAVSEQVAYSTIHRRRLFFFFLGQRTNSLPPLLSTPLLYSSFPLVSPHPLLDVSPLNTTKGLGSAVSSPVGSVAKPSRQTVWCIAYRTQKVQLRWRQILLIFLRTNVIFCTKTSLISYGVTIRIIDCQRKLQ